MNITGNTMRYHINAQYYNIKKNVIFVILYFVVNPVILQINTIIHFSMSNNNIFIKEKSDLLIAKACLRILCIKLF